MIIHKLGAQFLGIICIVLISSNNDQPGLETELYVIESVRSC